MTFRTLYPKVVEVTSGKGMTAEELAAWAVEQQSTHASRGSVSSILRDWVRLGAFRMEKVAVPHLITRGDRAGRRAGHAKFYYWPNMGRVWDPLVVTQAMGAQRAAPVLEARGVELVNADPPRPSVHATRPKPCVHATRQEELFPEPPPEREPLALFDAQFTGNGVLIPYDQFQRFAFLFNKLMGEHSSVFNKLMGEQS